MAVSQSVDHRPRQVFVEMIKSAVRQALVVGSISGLIYLAVCLIKHDISLPGYVAGPIGFVIGNDYVIVLAFALVVALMLLMYRPNQDLASQADDSREDQP